MKRVCRLLVCAVVMYGYAVPAQARVQAKQIVQAPLPPAKLDIAPVAPQELVKGMLAASAPLLDQTLSMLRCQRVRLVSPLPAKADFLAMQERRELQAAFRTNEMLASRNNPALLARVRTLRQRMNWMGMQKLTADNVRVIEAIISAGRLVGTDPAMLLTIAWNESLFVADAKVSSSSAHGPFQYIAATWYSSVYEFGGKYGLSSFRDHLIRSSSGEVLGVTSIQMASTLLGLRDDPLISSLLTAENIKRSTLVFGSVLKRRAAPGEIYLSHVLSDGKALQFIRAARTDPDLTTDEILDPLEADNNPSLFMSDGEYMAVGDAYKTILANTNARYLVFKELIELEAVGQTVLSSMATSTPVNSTEATARKISANSILKKPVMGLRSRRSTL